MHTKLRVKLTLQPYAREQAALMRIKRGLEVPNEFEGPDFGSVDKVELTPEWVHIRLMDRTVYSYPANSVARVAQYVSDVFDDDIPF